jgi:transglutaminase-like putative cysteine protease
MTLRLTWPKSQIKTQPLIALLLLVMVMGGISWTVARIFRELTVVGLLLPTLVALFLGWGLAALKPRHMRRWLAALLLAVIGVEFILIAITTLEQQLIAVIWEIAVIAQQMWQWPATQTLPAGEPTLQALAEVWNSLNTLLRRSAFWLVSLAQGRRAVDPIATTLAWSIIMWMIAAWASWVMQRERQPLLALLPAGTLQATLLAYFPSQAGNLLLLAGATLLLIGLVNFATREIRWQTLSMDVAPTIPGEVALAVVPIAIVLFVLASMTPSVSIWKIARQLRQQFSGELRTAASVGELTGQGGVGNTYRQVTPFAELPNAARAPGLPQRHLIGSGPELSEQVTLLISTNVVINDTPPRFYWRGLTYNNYSGRGWNAGQTRTVNYQPNQVVLEREGKPELQQAVEVVQPQGWIVYASGNLKTVDQPFSTAQRNAADIFAATTRPRHYRAASYPTIGVSVSQLKAAGIDYPDGIKQMYLQLPDAIPERVLALARDLTATAPTPYDRAKAIEAHLRKFPYNLDLPIPPADRDLVDYFLFDLQQGYCDYYATSMVVLARASGIPARLAVGYASGSYDPAQQHYVITAADAHSWPELYFPGIGWVEFEPTAAQPVPAHNNDPAFIGTSGNQTPQPETTRTSMPVVAWWLIPVTLLLMGAVAGGGWWLWDIRRLARLERSATIAQLFDRLWRHGRWLAIPLPLGATPYELSTAWHKALKTPAVSNRWQWLITPISTDVGELVQLYVQAAYSKAAITSSQQQQAILTWQRLQWRLWILRWLQQAKLSSPVNHRQ